MLLALVSCSKFDDSSIWEELKEHESRILKLETLCNQMNTNVTSLQTIVTALQENDYVKNIAPIMENGKEIGYTITFAKNGSITIYHGKDGNDGEDGKDGENGKDGINGTDGSNGKDGVNGKDGLTPVIGVRKYTDGVYYWTLNGEWLLDDAGNKIPTTGKNGTDGSDGKDGVDGEDGRDGANGTDGEDGQDGKDGITPQLKIEDDYWYISYDNGLSWQKLGKATGDNGLDGSDGEDGDSIIKSITQDEDNVYFNLSDGTLLTLPKRNSDIIVFKDLNVEALCVRNWDVNRDGELSYDEAASVTSLGEVFKENMDIISFEEFEYFVGLKEIESGAFKGCGNLWRICIPKNVEVIQTQAFYACESLENIIFEGDNLIKISGGNLSIGETGSIDKNSQYKGAFAYCESLRHIYLPESLEILEKSSFAFCSSLEIVSFGRNSKLKIIEGDFITDAKHNGSTSSLAGAFMECSSLREIYIPSGVTEIGAGAFYKCTALKKVIFEANSQLSTIGGGFYDKGPAYAGAFAFCSSLEDIDLPHTITTIFNSAFYGCSSLKLIKMNSLIPPTLDCISERYYYGEYTANSYHFKGIHDDAVICIPSQVMTDYADNDIWSNYKTIFSAINE